MNLRENGFVDMLYKEAKRSSIKAMSLYLQSSNIKAYPLNLKHFECILIAYCVAIAISVTVFVLEILKVYEQLTDGKFVTNIIRTINRSSRQRSGVI
nr:unnamed protein product [Callosobruchus analis]